LADPGHESVSAGSQSRIPDNPLKARWSASPLQRYGYAVIAIILATIIRVELDYWFGYHHQYSAFYVAVLFVAWYGGIGPALVAIALGAVAILFLAFGVIPGASGTLVGFEFFFIVSLTGVILFEAQRRAARRSAENVAIARDRLVQLELETAQRKRAEESARAAVEQLRITLENAPVGICRLALDGSFVEVNSRFSEITGYSIEELLNQDFQVISDEEDDEGVVPRLQHLARTRECGPPYCQEERRHVRRDGSALWIELRVNFVRDTHGNSQYAIGVLQDVTARKRAEEHLLKAQRVESIGLLAGGIAHDFNNLLTSVLGNASLAMKAVPPNSTAHEMLESIIASGERAAHLTGQLLAYAGKGGSWPGPLDLSETAREAVELARPAIAERIGLKSELNNNLPPIRADRSRVVQMITNLLINAAEAIEAGPGAISLRTDLLTVPEGEPPVAAVGEVQPGTYVALWVHDTGPGINSEVIPRMFEPFVTTKFTGRGLGLAAVAGIMRRNHGAVLVSSSPGEGTTLTVLFPVADGQPESAEPSRQGSRAGQ
jgi:two-component system cell cycle sensor histidine kinase/response regulator CckA